MDYYIVRIYRRNEQEDRNMIGLVETVGKKEADVFKSSDELWNILSKKDGPRGTKFKKENKNIIRYGKR